MAHRRATQRARISRLIYASLLFCAPVAAERNFAGYLKSFAILQEAPNLPGSWDNTAESQSSLRLMWDSFHNNVALQVHYEVSPVVVSRSTNLDNRGKQLLAGQRLQIGSGLWQATRCIPES